MKNSVLVFALTLILLILTPQPALAEDDTAPAVLCLPGLYLQGDPGDCQVAGPAAYQTAMARSGMQLPLRPLPTRPPDGSLAFIDIRYAEVRNPNAPVYATAEEAARNRKATAVRRLGSGFNYISYTDEAIIDGKRVVMIEYGAWMNGNDLIRLGAVPGFQGREFTRTPTTSFGWVLNYRGPVETKRTPGFSGDDYTGRQLAAYEVVPVFSNLELNGLQWYQIGPDEWLPEYALARVIPNTTPPEGVTGERWIEINLFEQTLAVYQDRQLIFATIIASGLDPFWTRPGVFQIFQKLERTPMAGDFSVDKSGAYYLEDVPWTMYYDGARALHGAYWRAKLGYPQSHGCVNLSVGDSNWLFQWAQDGDWVYVWDPSGETPTDPSLFGSGGY